MTFLKSATIVVFFALLFASLTTAEEKSGKDIFVNSKCNSCHAIKSQDIDSKMASKYPDLSNFGNEKLEADFVKKFINKEVDLNGKKHAVKFKGSDEELTTLVDWLLALKKE